MGGTRLERHGGELALAVARRARRRDDVHRSPAGHVFPLYDAAVQGDPPMRIVDVRHEQTAVFAAEGDGEADRAARDSPCSRPVPGSPTGSARSPGAPQRRRRCSSSAAGRRPTAGAPGAAGARPPAAAGAGHQPAATVCVGRSDRRRRRRGAAAAATPHRGPVFVDVPMDLLFTRATPSCPDPVAPAGREPDPDASPPSPGCWPPPSGRCSSSAPTCGRTGRSTPLGAASRDSACR